MATTVVKKYTASPYYDDFDESKKYPLFMFVYGGDGNQTVKDSWDSFNTFWFNHLTSKGYMVVSVDNRGTEGNGAEFRKSIYKQLGKYETEDQIAVAKYFELGLKAMSYIAQ